jgi:hypothetical protein
LVAQVAVDELDMEVELAHVLGLEAAQLPFEHHEAVQLDVIEEQVHVELSVTARDRDLSADEREAIADQEPGKAVGQRLRQVALPYRVGGDEVEDGRVLDDVLHRFRVRLGERLVERGQRLRPLAQPTGDHCLKRALVPPRLGVVLRVEVRGH